MELLKNILSGIMDNFEVEKYDGDNDNYRCKIRCSLSCEGDYDKKCGYFIEKFSEATQTNWIMLRRYA